MTYQKKDWFVLDEVWNDKPEWQRKIMTTLTPTEKALCLDWLLDQLGAARTQKAVDVDLELAPAACDEIYSHLVELIEDARNHGGETL